MTDPAIEQQAPESPNYSGLADTLESAFDELKAAEEEDVAEVEASDEPTDEVAEETVHEEREASEEPAQEASEEEVAEEEVAYNEPAPERWPSDMKEVYEKLDPEARKIMMEGVYKPMQAQYTQTTQELSQMRNVVEPMLETINQHSGVFERQGMDPVTAFNRQMQWAAHFAAVGPEQGLNDMRAAYGFEASPAEEGEGEPYLTPVERAMKAELSEIKQHQLQQQHGQQQQQQQQQLQAHQNRVAETQQGLNEFVNETKDGKPTHPHVERVAPAMAGLIRGGLVSRTNEYGQAVPVRDVVAQAYKMACDMDSGLRQAQGSTGQVAKAKAANRGVVTKVPAGNVDVQAGPLEDDISALYDKLSRR